MTETTQSAGTTPFGRFLEVALATRDIAASAQFYERLGFASLITGDAWPHRYGVFSDGRLHVGLHECEAAPLSVSFVKPELQRALPELRSADLPPESVRLGEDELHRVQLRDPGGHTVTLLEARTYSPPGVSPSASLCGYFAHLGLPERDLTAARAYWERAGLVALPKQRDPYPHLPLTGDALTLGLHAPRLFDAPMLVFECPDLAASLQRTRDLDIRIAAKLPRGLDPAAAALLEAPEGTGLLLLQAVD